MDWHSSTPSAGSGLKFTSVELERLLNEIPGSPLENIDFACANLNGALPDLLASAFKVLTCVNLYSTNLTNDQCIKLLEASLSSTTLIDLDLGNVNLSGVPPNLLASAVKRLKTIRLYMSDLTTDQCIKLLEASRSSTTLVDLALRYVNLSAVPPTILASAAKRLNTMDLYNTHLTTDQCIKLLQATLCTTTLVDLNLSSVNLSGVPPNLLESAVKCLKIIELSSTSMTVEQSIAVLKCIPTSTRLQYISLCGNNIREKLPADLQYLLTPKTYIYLAI